MLISPLTGATERAEAAEGLTAQGAQVAPVMLSQRAAFTRFLSRVL